MTTPEKFSVYMSHRKTLAKVQVPGPWTSVGQIMQANSEANQFYFSDNSVRSFDSHTESRVFAGRFLIESVSHPLQDRLYQVLAVTDKGIVLIVAQLFWPQFAPQKTFTSEEMLWVATDWINRLLRIQGVDADAVAPRVTSGVAQ